MFAQNTKTNQIKFNLDSLDLWNYDILKMDKNEKADAQEPVAKIAFFRTAVVQDSAQKNTGGLRPAVLFYVYPATKSIKIKPLSNRIILTSSCKPPDRGGLYYVLKNFVLLNYTSCTLCSISTDKTTDLCKGNIEKILEKVTNKDYKSFE
jgi:hypothetical protein